MDAFLEQGFLRPARAELLAEQLSEKGDERSMDLLDSLLVIEFGIIKIFNERWREALESK
jgi:hypothetical protein